jgi:hypothetical protein
MTSPDSDELAEHNRAETRRAYRAVCGYAGLAGVAFIAARLVSGRVRLALIGVGVVMALVSAWIATVVELVKLLVRPRHDRQNRAT